MMDAIGAAETSLEVARNLWFVCDWVTSPLDDDNPMYDEIESAVSDLIDAFPKLKAAIVEGVARDLMKVHQGGIQYRNGSDIVCYSEAAWMELAFFVCEAVHCKHPGDLTPLGDLPKQLAADDSGSIEWRTGLESWASGAYEQISRLPEMCRREFLAVGGAKAVPDVRMDLDANKKAFRRKRTVKGDNADLILWWKANADRNKGDGDNISRYMESPQLKREFNKMDEKTRKKKADAFRSAIKRRREKGDLDA